MLQILRGKIGIILQDDAGILPALEHSPHVANGQTGLRKRNLPAHHVGIASEFPLPPRKPIEPIPHLVAHRRDIQSEKIANSNRFSSPRPRHSLGKSPKNPCARLHG